MINVNVALDEFIFLPVFGDARGMDVLGGISS